jgi:uncharacterized protein (TIGR00297 family)
LFSSLELLFAGIIVIAALAILAYRLKALDLTGSLSGAIISSIVFLAGGFSWFVMIVIFVGVSSAFTRYRYDYKRKLGSAQEKMGIRSWPNSVANGAVSVIGSVGWIYTHSEVFAVMFLTSVAAAMSDTLATEIGLLSHSRPRLITHPERIVEPGASGGTTMLGNLTALLTSAAISLLGVELLVISTNGILDTLFASVAVIIGSLSGMFFDSFLGATVQVLYKCSVCGKLTENTRHHGQPAAYVRGVRHFDNNVVNFVGILFGSLVSIGIYVFLVVK